VGDSPGPEGEPGPRGLVPSAGMAAGMGRSEETKTEPPGARDATRRRSWAEREALRSLSPWPGPVRPGRPHDEAARQSISVPATSRSSTPAHRHRQGCRRGADRRRGVAVTKMRPSIRRGTYRTRPPVMSFGSPTAVEIPGSDLPTEALFGLVSTATLWECAEKGVSERNDQKDRKSSLRVLPTRGAMLAGQARILVTERPRVRGRERSAPTRGGGEAL